jgi:hypothetical protein
MGRKWKMGVKEMWIQRVSEFLVNAECDSKSNPSKSQLTKPQISRKNFLSYSREFSQKNNLKTMCIIKFLKTKLLQ